MRNNERNVRSVLSDNIVNPNNFNNNNNNNNINNRIAQRSLSSNYNANTNRNNNINPLDNEINMDYALFSLINEGNNFNMRINNLFLFFLN